MAPELFGRPVRHDLRDQLSKQRIDIFALGTLIHAVLPWIVYVKCRDSIHLQVLSGQPPVRRPAGPVERPPWIPIPNHPVWDLVDQCREKKPEERPGLSEVHRCLLVPSIDPLPERWPSPPASGFAGDSFAWPPSSFLRTATVQLDSRRDGPAFQWRALAGTVVLTAVCISIDSFLPNTAQIVVYILVVLGPSILA